MLFGKPLFIIALALVVSCLFLGNQKLGPIPQLTTVIDSEPSDSTPKSSFPLIHSVENIFELLRHHQIEEAYQNYTSSGFKKETSFQTFSQFVKEFPIFTNEKMINYHSPIIEEGIGSVTLELKSTNQEVVTLDVLLINENNDWKILGLKILPNEVNSEFKQIKASEAQKLALLINAHLKSLTKENLEESYANETAHDFRKMTSFDKFKELIAHNSVLTAHKKIQYSKLTFNNNVATYGIYLTDMQDNQHYVEYDFIRENPSGQQEWKILQIVVAGS